MSEGSRTTPPTAARTRAPSLTAALDALLACAEQGLHPAGVLGDVRTLLSSRGLLLRGRSAARTAALEARTTRCSGDPATSPHGRAGADRP